MKLSVHFLALFLTVPLCSLASAKSPEEMLKQLDSVGRALAQTPCASPSKREVKRQPNQHEPSIQDEIVTVRCPGASAETIHAYSYKPAAILPLTVRITSPNPSLPKPFQVGAKLAGAVSALGKPSTREGPVLTYSLSQERPDQDTITFTHESGRISTITWVWAVD